MADVIEVAKTGRATCRTCREGIPKGELRFGEEVANAFNPEGGTTHQWHHLRCAAKKKPSRVKEALATFEGDVPNRDEIEKLIAENQANEKPSKFPWAEHASTGRSRCGACHELIEKGALRVATEREDDTQAMAGMAPAPRYYHLKCAFEKSGIEDLGAKLKANSKGLKPEDVAAIEAGG